MRMSGIGSKARVSAALLAGLLWACAALAADKSCDRRCLAVHADGLIESMLAHDPGRLPLAHTYKATENGIAAGLPMMNAWNTASGAGGRFYVIDPVSGQLFLIVELREGSRSALLFGRLKVVRDELSELELFIDRSRGDTGYQFDATRVGTPAPEWSTRVERSRLPDRTQLLAWGRSIFDSRLPAPPTAAGCVLMENGKIVEEYAEVAQFVASGQRKTEKPQLVHIPCGAPPDRPTDPDARTELVDEEQGIVISIGNVHGVVEPSLVSNPTISAFVPDSLLPPYLKLLEQWRGTVHATLPALVPLRATIEVAEMHRYYDGKLQGMYMLERLGPPGSHSPWVDK